MLPRRFDIKVNDNDVTEQVKQSLKTQSIDGETLYLAYIGSEWVLTIEPANRSNGTQRYDGWFPRSYSQIGAAKAAVTRKFGREWEWRTI